MSFVLQLVKKQKIPTLHMNFKWKNSLYHIQNFATDKCLCKSQEAGMVQMVENFGPRLVGCR